MKKVIKLSSYRINKITQEDKHEMYKRALSRLSDKLITAGAENVTREEFIKSIHLSIMVVNTMPKSYSNLTLDYYEGVMNTVHSAMYFMTVKELLQSYPIEKRYDGNGEWKNYFTTIEALDEYAINEIIGIDVTDLLWDYNNPTINRFVVNMMLIISNRKRVNGEQGLVEKFAQEFQIPLIREVDGEFKVEYQKPNLTIVE